MSGNLARGLWIAAERLPQYQALAGLLLPPSLVPKERAGEQPPVKPQPKQRTLNLGE